jgi:hypothetical protein
MNGISNSSLRTNLLRDLVMLVVGFALTTVAGTIITQRFQDRAWRNEHQASLREADRQTSIKLFEEVSHLMDKRLYRMRRVMSGSRTTLTPSEAKLRWDQYRETLFEWNDDLNRTLALVQCYFGDSVRKSLETDVHYGFRELGQALEHHNSADPDLREIEMLADRVNGAIYELDLKMIRSIKSGHVGRFEDTAIAPHSALDPLAADQTRESQP